MATKVSKEEHNGSVDTFDYRGSPADKAKTGGWIAASLILGIELCERLTTLGIAVNLVTYIVGTMHLSNARAANIVTNFLGTSFILCLLGGFLADTFLGRYLTIAIFSTIQSLGVTILMISTVVKSLRPPSCSPAHSDGCIPANGRQQGVLFLALYMTALGTGGLKSSVSGLGSDQFDESEPKEKIKMIYFFNWFFFCISVGSLMAVTVLVYIQDNVGRSWGYGICAASIMLAIIIFLSGTRCYRFKKRTGSPLTQIAQIFVAAWRNRRLELPSDPSLLYESGTFPKRKLKHSEQFRFLDKAAVRDPSKGENLMHTNPWKLSTVTNIEEVKRVIRMLPIWATTIMFWTVYAQMTTFSVEQATTMDRHIGKSFEIPPASLTVFFVGSILITIPIYDRLLIPFARRWTGRPQGLTTLQRIGVGLVFSALAMACAALTEIKRLKVARHHGLLDKPHATVPLSVFWLIPQFFFVGSGEAFTYIGQLDFFIRESPEGMKTMSTGLFLSTLALGFFFSSCLVTIVNKVTVHGTSSHGWLADNLNRGRLYNFYWLLTLLSVLNFIFYALFAKWYVYKDTTAPAEDSSEAMKDEKELNLV
uniref:TSA: Wollemia nobilis Ref_Wollemi_Transcript_8280_2236 transcribed RNA sequence n=1 Tax=Wollemia nobilis TaxID=56998 RepID=A0A0C9QUM5_9CONI